jgi:hypothetical protein
MLMLLQDIPVWLSVLMAMGGAIVCGINLGRTRWAAVLMGGFFAEALAMAFSRLAVMAAQSGLTAMGRMGAAFAIASLIGLAGRGAIVMGVAGLLADLRNPTKPPASQV